MNKRERLELIKKMIRTNEIETQNELVTLLRKEGLVATQATISRDINEIGITKVPNASHKYIYSLPVENTPQRQHNQMLIKSVEHISEPHPQMPCLIYVDTVPGNARLLKRMILENYASQIFSVVSDDDSLLIVASHENDAQSLREELKQWSV